MRLRKLVSLKDHNRSRQESWAQHHGYPRRNGIACPNCGEEMMDTDAYHLLTCPPQRHVNCPACDYKGLRLA